MSQDLQGKIVALVCECGKTFERPEHFIEKAKGSAAVHPGIARHYLRKINYCDECHHGRIEAALKRLPEVLTALASAE